ncbi:hypothetical protein TSAR_008470, partial [Trichomalopsis sarcophagae]
MEKLSSEHNVLCNFVQGELWKVKKETHYKNKIAIPFNIYHDDFQVNNVVGSHTSICNVMDRNEFGNNSIFRILIDEINFLQEEGLDLCYKGKAVKVYFVLGLLLSDNLGLNIILGFKRSFNTNFYCRMCKGLKHVLQKDNVLRLHTERVVEDYEDDCMEGIGINEYCIWNDVMYFHVYENYYVDVMHDWAEGVLRYEMYAIVSYYIEQKKHISLDILNNRMKIFDYAINNIKNIPPAINESDLKNKKLSMTASEMFNFTILFAFFVGDLISRDSVWQLYIMIRQISDIIYSKKMQIGTIDLLENLISEHHAHYQQLFNATLKPMYAIVSYYIEQKKYISLDILNSPINNTKNIPPAINESDLKNNKLSMTASEMFNFTILFAFFVGDLISRDSVWQLYIMIRQISDIIYSKKMQIGTIDLLQRLSPNITSCFIILANLSTIRCEAKHQPLNRSAAVTNTINESDLKNKKLSMTASEMFNFTILFAFFVGDLISRDSVWQLYIMIRQISDIIYSKKMQIASEMFNFTILFAFFVGDLISRDSVWQLYIMIRQISDIIYSKKMQIGTIDLLQRLSPNITSCFIILANLSTIRCEAKHQPLNRSAAVTNTINESDLKNKKLSMTASEMFNFTILFAFFVGDLISRDSVWQLYIMIRQISDIIYSKKMQI